MDYFSDRTCVDIDFSVPDPIHVEHNEFWGRFRNVSYTLLFVIPAFMLLFVLILIDRFFGK